MMKTAMMISHTQPPVSINSEELDEFALQELKRQHHRNDILVQLCQRTGWDWQQAERFLDKVEADHPSELATQEKRLALLFNLTRILEGLLVLAIGSLGILGPFLYNLRSGRVMIPGVDYPIVPSVLMAFFISPVYFWISIVIASLGLSLIAKGVLGTIQAMR
jgi:hypothetical protein